MGDWKKPRIYPVALYDSFFSSAGGKECVCAPDLRSFYLNVLYSLFDIHDAGAYTVFYIDLIKYRMPVGIPADKNNDQRCQPDAG